MICDWTERIPDLFLQIGYQALGFIMSLEEVIDKRLSTQCTKNEVFRSGFLQYMWLNPQETVDLVTFTEQILNEKLLFLCSGTPKCQFGTFKKRYSY